MPKFGLSLAFLLAALVLSGFRPKEDHVVAAGEGRFAIEGKKMDVHVESERMALYGTNFHVGADEQLNCYGAPSAQLMICSFGNRGMQIDGKVFSEVGLTLVAPSGISFGPIAEIQALQNFTAIAGRLDTADFMANRLLCSHIDGKILNEGAIHVGGDAIFIAGQIENIGTIAADTMTWVSGGSVFLGSATEHMRVRLSYDTEIVAGKTPFTNRGQLTAQGRVAFRSGDPYTQAFIQHGQGAIKAKEVEIEAPSTVQLAGLIDAPSIKVSRVHALTLDHLKTPRKPAWDLLNVGEILVHGPFHANWLRGKVYNDARFEEIYLSGGLQLELQQGSLTSGLLETDLIDLKAREWLLGGDVRVKGALDLSKVILLLQGKVAAICSDKHLKLGALVADSQNLKLQGSRVELTHRMEGISKLDLVGEHVVVDQAHIEAGDVHIQAPLRVRGKSELFATGSVRFEKGLIWEHDATLRLRTEDLQVLKGMGSFGSSIGTAIIEESKNFACHGPVFVKSLRHNGEGSAHIHGAIRAPGGIYLRTGQDITIDGDCNTTPVPTHATPQRGSQGGFVYLESTGGNVTACNIETSGAAGIQRGGDAGAISVFQSDALDYIGDGTYLPKAQAYLLGSRYIALGGSGVVPGSDGDIKIGNSTPHFPDRCPVTFKQGVYIAGGDLTFGFNTAVGFRQNARLDLSGGLYLSDMLVIGDLDLNTTTIHVYPHEVGKVTLSNGSHVHAGPTQLVVLGAAHSSARHICLAPAIGYDALPVDTKRYATAYDMGPQRKQLIQNMLQHKNGSLAPTPGRIYLQTMTPSMALIAPIPELMGHPIELQEMANESAAPIEILAEMITTSLARLDADDLAKWEGIREEVMQTHTNPASLPIERYQQRLRYAVFEPQRFLNSLGRSNSGRSALAFIEKVKGLIDALKAKKDETIISYLERFTQPPAVTAQRWRSILNVAKKQLKRPLKKPRVKAAGRMHS